jgi:hypothetical protein
MLKANPANATALQQKYFVMRAQQTEPTEKIMEALNNCLGQKLAADVSGWYGMAQMKLFLADFKGVAYAMAQVLLGSPLDAELHQELAKVLSAVCAKTHGTSLGAGSWQQCQSTLWTSSIANQYLEESAEAGKKADGRTRTAGGKGTCQIWSSSSFEQVQGHQNVRKCQASHG